MQTPCVEVVKSKAIAIYNPCEGPGKQQSNTESSENSMSEQKLEQNEMLQPYSRYEAKLGRISPTEMDTSSPNIGNFS